MLEEENCLDIKEHQFIEGKYKQIVYELEKTRAILIHAYPQSSRAKEAKKLELVIENMQLV
jgi:hypothetical protein